METRLRSFVYNGAVWYSRYLIGLYMAQLSLYSPYGWLVVGFVALIFIRCNFLGATIASTKHLQRRSGRWRQYIDEDDTKLLIIYCQ
jgi:hypothetical protein